MGDLDRALADIGAIRSQIARGTAFRGYGPGTLAATGLLAFGVAAGQSAWLGAADAQPGPYFGVWIATALVAVALIAAETVTRSRRLHSGLADAMIHGAIEQFLPAGAAGALLALVLVRFAPETSWLLPGLWQLFVALGLFASARSLPRGVGLAGAWYVVAGLYTIAFASGDHALSPWAMGAPFGVGQLLLALVLSGRFGGDDVER